jgi:hypothetical protein
MNVGELRKALEGVDDNLEIFLTVEDPAGEVVAAEIDTTAVDADEDDPSDKVFAIEAYVIVDEPEGTTGDSGE